jgi:hypothetical protein
MAPRKTNQVKKQVPLLENQKRKLQMQKIAKASKAAGGQKSGVKTPGSKGPQLPPTPKKPTTGTTYTIRATGGNSRDAKINRLSAQTKPISGKRPIAPAKAPQRPSAASNVAKTSRALQAAGARASRLAGGLGAVGVGANLFAQGKTGSVMDQAVKKLPGIKANPKTDLGRRAGNAISRVAKQAGAALKKQFKKSKMGY